MHPGLEEFETSVQTDLVNAPAEEKQLIYVIVLVIYYIKHYFSQLLFILIISCSNLTPS